MAVLHETSCEQTKLLKKTTKNNSSPKRLMLIGEKDLKRTKKEAKLEQEA